MLAVLPCKNSPPCRRRFPTLALILSSMWMPCQSLMEKKRKKKNTSALHINANNFVTGHYIIKFHLGRVKEGITKYLLRKSLQSWVLLLEIPQQPITPREAEPDVLTYCSRHKGRDMCFLEFCITPLPNDLIFTTTHYKLRKLKPLFWGFFLAFTLPKVRSCHHT